MADSPGAQARAWCGWGEKRGFLGEPVDPGCSSMLYIAWSGPAGVVATQVEVRGGSSDTHTQYIHLIRGKHRGIALLWGPEVSTGLFGSTPSLRLDGGSVIAGGHLYLADPQLSLVLPCVLSSRS